MNSENQEPHAVEKISTQDIIAIWAKTVETQMHFNEMQVKSRQLGLTFVTAALGIGIVLLSEGNDFSFQTNIFEYKFNIHISVLLVVGAMLALQAVKVLDLNVYHRMLRGAVSFGEDFEKNCLVPLIGLEKGMTSSISHFSRLEDAKVVAKSSGKYSYSGEKKITAYDKIQSFYRWTQIFLLIAAALLLFFTNASSFGNQTDIKSKHSVSPEIESPSISPKTTDLENDMEGDTSTKPNPNDSENLKDTAPNEEK